MRILKIIPGSGGGFLCENCLRDQALIAELRWAGHEVTVVPLYLPMADTPGEQAAGGVPLFYGAVRVFLEHRLPLLRRAPRWFRRRLDAPRVLRYAARRASTSSSVALADLTLSVLRGEHGQQAHELDMLCAWLKEQPRPDVIHLSNALLLGLARRLGLAAQAPVVCSLQDEDTWIDAMPPALAKRAWSELRARVPDAAGFLSVSHYFAAKMPRRMGVSLKALRVVHPGIDAARFPAAQPSDDPVWGVLLTPGDLAGLTRVLSAFLEARARPGGGALRLRVAGAEARAAADRPAYAALHAELAARALPHGAVEWQPAFTQHAARKEFLRSLGLLTVLHAEEPAFDLSLLEAMAGGVAVVQPAEGANPEILEMAEGGVLFDPAREMALADAVAALAGDPGRRAALARRGRHGVEHHFSLARMARETIDAYQAIVALHSPLAHRRNPAARSS